MKFIEVVWRDPAMNMVSERFDVEKFLVEPSPGWLGLWQRLADARGELVRLIPSDKVCLVQFAEEDKPRILRPTGVQMPS